MARAGSCAWNAIVLSNAGCGRRFAIARSAACGGFSLWRKHCEAGEDTDYYKKPVFLTLVKEGPFYALKVGPALLTFTGGFRIDVGNDFAVEGVEFWVKRPNRTRRGSTKMKKRKRASSRLP